MVRTPPRATPPEDSAHATMTSRPTTLRLSRLAALAFGAAVLSGCSASYDQNFFDYDREQSRTRRIFDAQYAAAAAEEASLRADHFHVAEGDAGPRLNALGRERLDYLAKARRPGEALTVHLDVDADEADEIAMLDAAQDYVARLGIPEGAILVEVGPAERVRPAADALAERDGMGQSPSSPTGGFGGGGDPMFGAASAQ